MLNKKVLVLNQNYEPLTISTVKRAVILLYSQKVEMVEQYEATIHSVSMSMVCPSVVRLRHYIYKPYRDVPLNRKNIMKRDNHTCQYCGKNSRPMTIDHVIPKSFGGKDTWENLVCACLKCNSKKGNRTPEAAGMKLLRKPKKPTHLFFLQISAGKIPQKWRPYLFID